MAANIMIGEWRIRPDSGGGWMLGRPVMRKNKKGEDVEVMRDVTYPSTLPNALKSLLERRIQESDATTIEDVANEIVAFREDVDAVFEIQPVEVSDG